jgi:DNA topoisomerase-1
VNIVIVESPAKSKTITSYLGKGFKVMASFGHIRDLPSKDGSIDTENQFEMHYQISDDSKKTVAEIVAEVKKADAVYLATDPDREGEAISWHILEVLKEKKALPKKVYRITFNQITKSAILNAVANPRDIDVHLVDAQQCRLALDYLMGFNISPVLWRKLPGSKSAGRVQSVALRLVCQREKEIEEFKKEEYWTIDAKFEINNNLVNAELEIYNNDKLEKFSITDAKQANEIVNILSQENFKVLEVQKKETKRKPYAPFTTSTLQQEASSKLYFSPKRTMQIAQTLYEGVKVGNDTKGLITYMRTDSNAISQEGINGIRNLISKEFGDKYLPSKPVFYASKVQNAQEAHEAIRPTDPTLIPSKIKEYLKDEQFKLYELIWARAVASQMENAMFEATKVSIGNNKHSFKANGSVIKFDGFLKIYPSSSEDTILPAIAEGDDAQTQNINPAQHFTQPPARYTEAILVKTLEEEGIGRPSTYASTLSVIQEREYVKMNEQKRLQPEMRGRVVSTFLEKFFTKYVEYSFTASLEKELDEIAEGQKERIKFLQSFWKPFKENVNNAMQIDYTEVTDILNKELANVILGTDEDGNIKNKCPSCSNGILGLKLGKYGVFVACNNYPECKYIQNPTSDNQHEEMTENKSKSTFDAKEIGTDGKKVYMLKKGPYGFYIEIDEGSSKTKPKRVSIPKTTDAQSITMDFAKKLASLPITIGQKDGTPVQASIGPYGPYIVHNKKYVNVKTVEEIFAITIEEASAKIDEALSKPKTKRTFAKKTSKK